MDEYYVESLYEKTKMYQPWVPDNSEDFESDDEGEIRENWVYQQPQGLPTTRK